MTFLERLFSLGDDTKETRNIDIEERNAGYGGMGA